MPRNQNNNRDNQYTAGNEEMNLLFNYWMQINLETHPES